MARDYDLIVFGATIDDALGDEVRVTVIAAGFDGGMPKRRNEGTVLRGSSSKPQQSQAETRNAAEALASSRPRPTQQAQPAGQASQSAPTQPQPTRSPQQAQPAAPKSQPRQVQFDDDDLDVPDFLK